MATSVRTSRESGQSLLVCMIVLSIVTVWLANSALVTGYGVLAAANTRDRLDARIAAGTRVDGDAPATPGGSLWPEAAVLGFHDFLVGDDATGRLRVVPEAELPRSGDVVLRQWRLAPDGDGGTAFEVSTVILDAGTRQPVAPPRGGGFRRSRMVQ